MKITKVYTRTGDKGTTSLVGGVRISKSSPRLEAYGTVDELSAHLGLLVSLLPEGTNRQNLIRIQNNLFNVCTHAGFNCNYNIARDRLEGGEPRKPQLRIRNYDDFVMKVRLISPKRFSVIHEPYTCSRFTE